MTMNRIERVILNWIILWIILAILALIGTALYWLLTSILFFIELTASQLGSIVYVLIIMAITLAGFFLIDKVMNDD